MTGKAVLPFVVLAFFKLSIYPSMVLAVGHKNHSEIASEGGGIYTYPTLPSNLRVAVVNYDFNNTCGSPKW